MVKYELEQDIHVDVENVLQLNNIANELADLVEAKKYGNRQAKEANRLKRIELDNEYAIKEELKDEA